MSLTLSLQRLADRYNPVYASYTYDPVAWCEDILGEEMWSRQMDLMDAVADHRYVAVKSAHSTGKSWTGGRLTAWWLEVHPEGSAFVVTSAPTQPQVEAVLWREIARAHTKGKLHGRITSGAVPMWKIGNEIIAYGRKPADYRDTEKAMQAFQGIHARYVLVILDEACGIPKWLWDATDTLVTNEDSHVLAIGNPDDPTAEFERVCRPGSGWHVMKISAFDTPAFTGEPVSEHLAASLVSETWVDERKKRWGEGSMLYTSKVLAEFPEVTEDTLITPAMVLRAQQQSLPGLGDGRFGCDIARYGDDQTVIMRNQDGVIRTVTVIPKSDTMETAGRIGRYILDTDETCPAVIDVIGVGAGVYDRVTEMGRPAIPFDSSSSASNPRRFKNLRAEMWWTVRELFEEGAMDIDDTDDMLASELLAIKYSIDSAGRIYIEPKELTKKQLGRSPDKADALMMSCYMANYWSAPQYDPRNKKRTVGITDDLLTRQL
jgi:hypothetical protein